MPLMADQISVALVNQGLHQRTDFLMDRNYPVPAGCRLDPTLKIPVFGVYLFGLHLQQFIQPESGVQIDQDGAHPILILYAPQGGDLVVCKRCPASLRYRRGGG